jgi:glutathione S-transferase
MTNAPHILYGGPVSLYTGKVRSYLRKNNINFVEVHPNSERYLKHVVPTVGRWIMPCLETPDGRIIQDGADIIDYFDAEIQLSKYPTHPTTAVHRAVTHLFELFGGEGLLRAAMHYRWNFDEQNLSFLESEFGISVIPKMTSDQISMNFARSSGRMRKAAVTFGVGPHSAELIESSFMEWLSLFSAHLEHNAYLLGNKPTLGDYCLMGPMWAHLFRDPAPTAVIKKHAPRVGRWVERMSTYEPYDGEYFDSATAPRELVANDALPDTLVAMMRYVAEEYLPEITAHVEYANEWLTQQTDLVTGTNGLPDPGARGIGKTAFAWRGIEIETAVMPYRFWLMQRLHDAVAAVDASSQAAIRTAFSNAGLESLLDLRTIRRVERVNHLEVWGPLV